MPLPLFFEKSFALLHELRANNNKPWFDAHRSQIDEYLIRPFTSVLEQVTEHLAPTPWPLSGGKKTIFRMHRDVRFSHDKRPYKDSISGLLTPSGRKTGDRCLIYVHLGAEECFVAAGFYQLPTAELNQLRQNILTNESQFASIVTSMEKARLEWLRDGALKTMPRGFDEFSSHRFANFLRLKSLVVKKPLSQPLWLSGQVVKTLATFGKDIRPLLTWGENV